MTLSSKAIASCALIILICIGALSFLSESRNEDDRKWVAHTLLVVEKLQAVPIDITQAETGQRGYLLSGQDRYLELYRAGDEKLGQDTKALWDLTSGNHGEREAIQRLESLIADRLTELADGIEARKKSGLLAGVEAVSHRENGELWTGVIAAHIAEIRQTEAQLLSTRMEAARVSTRRMKVILACGNSLAILILLVKGFVIHRETCRRNLAEQNLKQANEKLERRTAELSETNIELESFAYSVAHDLRAPLRHIAGYSGVLTQDSASRLDTEGLRCLGKITDCARQMGHLVDDLLGLSQIGRQKLSFRDTALSSLVAQAVEDIAPEVAGRVVEWQIADLFNAKCDPGLMKQVFMNLLSNAAKYTRRREHVVIQVGQITQNDERVVFVRDNGVGFEMQYADKLF